MLAWPTRHMCDLGGGESRRELVRERDLSIANSNQLRLHLAPLLLSASPGGSLRRPPPPSLPHSPSHSLTPMPKLPKSGLMDPSAQSQCQQGKNGLIQAGQKPFTITGQQTLQQTRHLCFKMTIGSPNQVVGVRVRRCCILFKGTTASQLMCALASVLCSCCCLFG